MEIKIIVQQFDAKVIIIYILQIITKLNIRRVKK